MIISAIFNVLSALIICAIFLLIKMFYLVQQSETIVIERLGKYHKTLQPGLHCIIPFIDCPRLILWTFFSEGKQGERIRYTHSSYRIDLRESVYDFPKQNVITRDNVMIEISALLYFQIIDPRAAVYEFDDLPAGIEKLTQTTLRNVIGSMDLDETLVSRDAVNQRLRIILDESSHKWGVKVNRVELQEVTPPADIRIAMEKQMRAERDRRAVILEAEGLKRAAILTAEGEQESAVLRSRGAAEAQVISANAESESRLRIAEGEAKAIELITQSLPKCSDPSAFIVANAYIKTLPSLVSGSNNKLIVLPYEAASLMGSLSGIKKLFTEIEK